MPCSRAEGHPAKERQMRRSPHFLLVGAACVFVGCVHYQEVLEPVGPAPTVPVHAPAQGFLRVYTPTERYNDSDVYYYLHQDFRIYSLNGHLVEYVRNADSNRDETPALTPLPVGTYKIRSWTRRSGIATIPVVIELGRTTDVYLDGSFEGSGAPRDAYVTLPTGEIIGWHSKDSQAP